MKTSGKLKLVLLPALALLLAPPVAGWKAGKPPSHKDTKANRHHLEGKRLHSALDKDEVSLEDLETVSHVEKKHVQEATEAPSSIEDQLRLVDGLEAETDASFQKAISLEEKKHADEQSLEDKALQELAEKAPPPSPSAPTAVSLAAPVHEQVAGLEELDPVVGGASAPRAKTGQAKMSNADQTPIDHRAQLANAPVASLTDKQAQADGARLLEYSLDRTRLRLFFEEMMKNGGRDRVTRAETVAKDIKNEQHARTNAPVVLATDKQAQADAATLLKDSNDNMRRHAHSEEMLRHGGQDRVNRGEAVASKIRNNKGAQADATMLVKYKKDHVRLRAFYEEMNKNGGQDRVARAEALLLSPVGKTNPEISLGDKAPIDHHVPSRQGNINAAAVVVSGMSSIPRPATAPSVLKTHQQVLHVPEGNQQALIDATLLIKHEGDIPRLSSIYAEMRMHGGTDRVTRAEAMIEKMQK